MRKKIYYHTYLRTVNCLFIKGIPNSALVGKLYCFLYKLIINAFMDKGAGGCDTALAHVGHAGVLSPDSSRIH